MITDDNKESDDDNNYAVVADNYDSYDDNDELMRGIKIVLIDVDLFQNNYESIDNVKIL